MLSLRKEYMIGKSGCRINKEKDWSQVSSLPGRSGMIRIVHIFAPKIIKCDVANFRELVQRLTGNEKRSRSGNKSKRSANSSTSSPPRAHQILSQCSNARNIFISSGRVEYSIPRSPDSYLSPPSVQDFHKYEADVKPRIRQPSCIDVSCSSSDQSCCSPFPFVEVTSPHFDGHQSQKRNSINVDCNDGISSQSCCSPFPFAEVTTLHFLGHRSQKLNPVNVDCDDGIPSSALRSSRFQQQTAAPILDDPFRSLSGYREKLPPTPQRSSTRAFSSFDERSHLTLPNRFSVDMDNTLTGLVTPGPLQEIPMALPLHVNTSSDFTFQSSLVTNSNCLCRFSVQSPLRSGIQQIFDHF
ncbi:unnamed protein product [Calypogeia fissa]